MGDSLEFVITTYNQGNVPLADVVITDYIPAGFQYTDVNDLNGWTASGSNAEFTIAGPILPGDNVTTSIFLTLVMTDGADDAYTNVSEVSMMSDTTGMDISNDDADSDINNDPDDNGGGAPGTDSDDSIDGDGMGMPGDEDAATDEDNSDPALVEIFDLAIIMENSTDQITMYDQDITFPITLVNQGNVDSEMPVITVMVPDGFMFDPANNPGWVDNGDGTVSYTYPDTLEPGDVEMFDLVLTSQPGTSSDSWTPIAEITEDNAVNGAEDIDSNPDANFENDAGGNPLPDTGDNPDGIIGSDDSLDGDGTGGEQDTDAATDEDDNDPEFVRIVDVAQTKTLVTAGPFMYGQVLEFTVTTYNQGNVPLIDVVVTDYIPAGFAYDASSDAEGWVDNGDGTAMTTIAGPIENGTPVVTTIYMILEMSYGGTADYVNVSEVSMMSDDMGMDVTGDDVDSELNNDPDDNGGGAPGTDSDDSIDGDGMGMPGDEDAATDEDNSDPALVEIVDLALTKTTTEAGPFSYGQSVLFTINVRNQGSVDAQNILITDYIPEGFAYDPTNDANGWSLNGSNAEYTITDVLAAGDITMIDIMLILQETAGGDDNYTNVAEITTVEDTEGNDISGDDIDSSPDADSENDPGGEPGTDSDNTMIGDGTNGGGAPGDTDADTDEDDQDPELIPIFDLALQKHIMMTEGYAFGDEAMFMIEVTNQGNIPAVNVEITDYIPSGYQFVAGPNWTDNGDGTATYASIATLAPGETVTLDMSLIVVMTEMFDNHTNFAEISYAEDENGNDTNGGGPDGGLVDVDSTPDAINDDGSGVPGSDDAGGEPGTSTDDIWDNQEGDEDDHDPAIIRIIDVALVKTIAPDQTPYMFGQAITFNIDVTNQGNVDLYNVDVTDYIPAGFTYDPANDANGWTDNGDGTAVMTIAGPIERLQTETVTIDLILTQIIPATDADATSWTNEAEVSHLEDENDEDITSEDIDSSPDNMPDNDTGGEPGTEDDDNTGGDSLQGEDEDDHDPALVPVFDLALTKELVYPDSIYTFGDEMEFMITLHNQGNIPSTDIEVTEYIPGALTEVGATNVPEWVFSGITATYLYTDTLQAGMSDTILLNMVFQEGITADDYVNNAENK